MTASEYGRACDSSRTPHGVRGLKLHGYRVHALGQQSHPSRGAWIEILVMLCGSWRSCCRTPHGVRGLKFQAVEGLAGRGEVAPLTGCVD